jgi:DNA polymerase IV
MPRCPRRGRSAPAPFDSPEPSADAGRVLRALAIDFNSYFASVEQQERPELRGQPFIVVPVLAETTGAIAVSIEAKAMGLKRNMRLREARHIIPHLAIVEARPEVYIRYHHRLRAVVESCVPVKKVQSIDELECDLSGSLAEPARALQLARRLKRRIAAEVGPCLRSSIGIGPNWFLAKVASDMQKPDGLVMLDDADVPAKLLHLTLEDFCGIGPNLARRLRAAGITTVAQLYAAESGRLRRIWGSVEGARFHDWLHGGRQEREESRHRTLGHSHVLPPRLREPAAALAVLHRLLQKAAMRLRHEGFFAGSLHVHARFAGGPGWSDECHFDATQDTLQFTHVLNRLWADRPGELHGAAPLQVGVVLGRLLASGQETGDLFADPREPARRRLMDALDQVNRTFGKNSVYFGGAHGATDYAPMRIAFTRIPDPELEEIDQVRQRRLRPRPGQTSPPPADEA